MGKTISWILLIVLAVVVFYLALNFVKDKALPLVTSPEEFEQMEQAPLTSKTEVFITLDDNTYHVRGCPYIKGPTEKIFLEAAERMDLSPCVYCIKE